MNITDKLKKMGYTTVNDTFYDYIAMWDSWYKGNVDKFHTFRVFNGQRHVKCHRYSLGMAKKVCEDWASLLMNEKVHVTLEGEKEQEFIDSVFAENAFEVNANELQERCAATGTYAFVPDVRNTTVDSVSGAASGGAIKINYVSAANIFPLSWVGREITECAFTSYVNVCGKKYVYMQLHVIENGEYVIKNMIFACSGSSLSDVSFADVPGYESVAPEIRTRSAKRTFVIGRFNIANNIDCNNPLGISVYANAIDTLKGVDVAYDSYVNEFVLGKKRIMVKPAATKDLDGNPVFDLHDLTYYVLPEDTSDGTVIKEIDMTLRTAEHMQGLQDQLNMLSSKCGFGENHYRFDRGNITTATQVISENSAMFRTIKKHEIVLESVLIELCRLLLHIGNTFMNGGFDEDVEITVDFDDSIIEDESANFQRDLQLLNAGIMNDWEFRMRWMNEDEDTAKAAIPRMNDITTEAQDDTE